MNEIKLKPQNSSKRNRCCKSSKTSSCRVIELTANNTVFLLFCQIFF